jgi:hypothetical protein
MKEGDSWVGILRKSMRRREQLKSPSKKPTIIYLHDNTNKLSQEQIEEFIKEYSPSTTIRKMEKKTYERN